MYAVGEAMREEYKAIVDAGLILQLDDPAIAENWDMVNPEPSLEDYKKFSMVRVEALNHAIRGLPQDRGLRDMQAAYDYLAARKDVKPGRIGAVGWCMGGGLALQLAIHQPRLGAVVVNYGALPTDPNDMQQIGAAVLGNFGADDKGITPADVQAFEKTMRGMNRRVDVKIYPGAGHAFENPNNTDGYRPEAAADAWKRTLAFLHNALG